MLVTHSAVSSTWYEVMQQQQRSYLKLPNLIAYCDCALAHVSVCTSRKHAFVGTTTAIDAAQKLCNTRLTSTTAMTCCCGSKCNEWHTHRATNITTCTACTTQHAPCILSPTTALYKVWQATSAMSDMVCQKCNEGPPHARMSHLSMPVHYFELLYFLLYILM